MKMPDSDSGPGPKDDGPRDRRRAALIVLAVIAAGALYKIGVQRLSESSASDAPRFTMQSVPRTLPPVAFVDGNGQPASLDRFRGKVLLLNIWATWCAPCRKEMPSLDRLQAQLGGSEFQVVALSIDTGSKGLDAVRSFYARLGLRHLFAYQDPEGAAGLQLGTMAIPTTLLIDHQGREIGRMSGAAEWHSSQAVAFVREHIGVPQSEQKR